MLVCLRQFNMADISLPPQNNFKCKKYKLARNPVKKLVRVRNCSHIIDKTWTFSLPTTYSLNYPSFIVTHHHKYAQG